MSAFEDFVTEIREFYDLDTVFPKSVGQAYTKAAAELERLEAVEAAAPQAVKALWLAINSDKDSQRRGEYKAAIAALSPQPGDGDEKG
jgi:hypothetical protein